MFLVSLLAFVSEMLSPVQKKAETEGVATSSAG